MSIRVGIDVGGTFTDMIAIDDARYDIQIAKVPSTRENQANGVMNSLDCFGADLGGIESIVHGTTVGTNILVERNGAVCGLITTRGFRDNLELARRGRPYVYGLNGNFKPLIPRHLRVEVRERIDARGEIVEPLDEEDVIAAARLLLERGAEAVVIGFINSYINDVHERRAKALAQTVWPNGNIVGSSEILPQYREFERISTAAVNAYLQPKTARYLDRLSGELARKNYGSELLVMLGSGGVANAETAARLCVNTIGSGPAAGVMAAAMIGKAAGFDNIIACDMGGTSFDVSLVVDGRPRMTTQTELSYGLPVQISLIDIQSIGAGGGSIARINEQDILQVGPRSAGAQPGPICYGRGGSEPTITDANAMLRRIVPERLASIRSPGLPNQVEAALNDRIARPMGLAGAEEAALAIIKVANANMSAALRSVSIDHGFDPREFALVSYGGATGLHATALARELSIPTVIVPLFPGLTSAFGCLNADLQRDFSQTLDRPLDDIALDEVVAIRDSHVRQAAATLLGDGRRVQEDSLVVLSEADMQYVGQVHTLRLPMPAALRSVTDMHAVFEREYESRYGGRLENGRSKITNLRTTVILPRGKVDLARLYDATCRKFEAVERASESRSVRFEGGWRTCQVLRRETLRAGDVVEGPAILEQVDSTVLLDPGDTARVDPYGNLVISVGA